TAPIFGPRGRYKGRVWHFRDVTEARENVRLRRVMEVKYRHLFEAQSDPVLVLDAGTRRVEDANKAALAKFGWTKKELSEMRAEELDNESATARAALKLYWRRQRWPKR